jgi:hypothetical protein
MLEIIGGLLERVMSAILFDSFFWGENKVDEEDWINPQLWQVGIGDRLVADLRQLISCGGVEDRFSVSGESIGALYRIQVFSKNSLSERIEVMRVEVSYPNQFLPMIMRDGDVLGQPFHYCKNIKELKETSEELLFYLIWPHIKVVT